MPKPKHEWFRIDCMSWGQIISVFRLSFHLTDTTASSGYECLEIAKYM